jgi:hypothetical protein
MLAPNKLTPKPLHIAWPACLRHPAAANEFGHPSRSAPRSKSGMPKKAKSRSVSKTTSRSSTRTRSSRTKNTRTTPAHIDVVPAARRVIRPVVPVVARPKVEEITTITDVETVPTIEVRQPATLSQALTEPATIVEKPETRVIGRTVKKRRVA